MSKLANIMNFVSIVVLLYNVGRNENDEFDFFKLALLTFTFSCQLNSY